MGDIDRNGGFISANEKVLDMHLKDGTLANRLGSGITLKSSFDVKPGGSVSGSRRGGSDFRDE
jgi:hypothetical protein